MHKITDDQGADLVFLCDSIRDLNPSTSIDESWATVDLLEKYLNKMSALQW